jgi:signal transduction histidine kinase
MDNHRQTMIAEESVRFFGKVTAVISHDFKNVLAIINERSGLLEDIALLAKSSGSEVDPARIIDSVAMMSKHVKRADGIVKNMNRFAHSIDTKIQCVDLEEVVLLFTELAEKVASRRDVKLRCNSTSVKLVTMPFLLLYLLWRILEHAIQSVRSGSAMVFEIDVLPDSQVVTARIRLSWQPADNVTATQQGAFPSELESIVVQALHGHLDVDDRGCGIAITLTSHESSG